MGEGAGAPSDPTDAVTGRVGSDCPATVLGAGGAACTVRHMSQPAWDLGVVWRDWVTSGLEMHPEQIQSIEGEQWPQTSV